ncbi:MAG: hypothetical protein VR68_07200 [Peptococcaceae bacterium BRH_c4a]|nr:MAG: hypothetical protein VR68_07200 [Peptococcaceae bacterium BRH_c4a]
MINDQELAERFCLDADRIIQDPSAEIIRVGDVPEEYIESIELARSLVSEGLIDQCGIRDQLRRRLLEKLAGRIGGLGDSDELDDYQLDMVAAGTGSEVQGDNCSVCGCSRSASAIKGGICPDCGRPRGSV